MNAKKTFTMRLASTAVALAWGVSVTGPVLAQTGDVNDSASTRDVTQSSRWQIPMDEMTVTTRKVEENLKEVPLSITAFDAGTIYAAGIQNLQDVADLTPGLSFFNAFGENLPVPIIRGIAQTDIFGETNAAVFVDGVYVAGREGLNFSQLDIERIEVVKGPQSALYGRTAFSGAINYITKRPSDEFESRIDAEAGNRGKIRGSAMVSGPIFTEKLRGRVAALYDEWDGSYDNSEHPDTQIGGRIFRSFQGSLAWYPTDRIEIYGSLYHSNDDIDDPAAVGVLANCENRLDDDLTDIRYLNFCGEVPTLKETPSTRPGLVDQDRMPKVARARGENRELFRGILNIDWDTDIGAFTALTGFSTTEQSSVSDFGRIGDLMPFLYCNGASVEAPGSPNSCGANPADEMFFSGVLDEEFGSKVEELSQEIRFTSNRDQRVRYTVGGYFYTSHTEDFDGGIIQQAPAPGLGIGLPPFDPSAPNFAIGTAIFYCGFTNDGCLDPLNRPTIERDVDSWAVFTGLDFDFTDRLIGRLELRYTAQREKVSNFGYALCEPTGLNPACGDDYYDLRFVEPLPFDPDNQGATTNSASNDFSSVTGRVGLDYKLNDGWMIYGSIATGDKPGGIDLEAVDVITPTGTEAEVIPQTFDPEELTAYEIGLKGFTEDGRIGLDVALFFNDWQDIVLRQLVETSPISGRPLEQPEGFRFNAGTAEVWGFEMTADVAFTERFTGRFAVNWNDSTLTDAQQSTFQDFPSFTPDGDVSGNKLLRQPEWMGSATLNYRRQIWKQYEGFVRADAFWQDKVFIGNDNQSWLAARTTVNLRMGVESGRFSLTFWADNLLNQDEPIAAFRDIFWSNSDSLFPPYADLGPRPSFDKFVPIRYSVSYPNLRTYGLLATVRFGRAAN